MWLNLALPAQAIDILKIHEVYFEHRTYERHSRSDLVPVGEHLTGYYALYMDIALAWRIHFRSRIHSTTTNAQFRTIGWQYWLGVRPWDWVEIGVYHHSQHALDVNLGRFPLEDGVYLKLWFNRF